MRPVLINGAQLIGGVAIAVGAWMVFPPASIVLAGTALIVWAEGRRQ